MIKHEPTFDTEKVCKLYSEKDGVPIKYVCSTALDDSTVAMDIFYRETPNPKFGNKYFGLFNHPLDNTLRITNADKIEELEFGLIEDTDGNLHYSSHRHDYKSFNNGNMIDGGRAYIRCSGNVENYVVRNGEMLKNDIRS
jgi:hypothetical protein